MSNGIYNEVKRILSDPTSTPEERAHWVRELLLDMHQIVECTKKAVERQEAKGENREARIKELESHPSLHQWFSREPIKVTVIILTLIVLSQTISAIILEALKHLLPIL